MVVGKTGTGKTSLLHRLIHDDILLGRGVCVIDPTGNLVTNILQSSIPDHRIDDVVVLDLSNTMDGCRYPPPLNPLFKPQPGKPVSNSIISTLERLEGEFVETKMARLLQTALLTLAAEPHPTLLDVRRLFRDERYRRRLVDQTSRFTLTDAWQDIEQDKQLSNSLDGLFSRLGPFYDNDQLMAISCHPDQLDVWHLVRENKIILVSLRAGGNDIETRERDILGSAVFSQIEAVARAGAISSGPYMLYIDETQHYVDTSIPTMLAEMRQFNLGLVLANQYMDQLAGVTKQALEGNVATMVVFEVGHDDANTLSPYMSPSFTAKDLTRLGKFKAAVSMRVGENREPAFLLGTLPPPTAEITVSEARAREKDVRLHSIRNYTPKTEEEVLDWLARRYGNGDQSETDDPGAEDSNSGQDNDAADDGDFMEKKPDED